MSAVIHDSVLSLVGNTPMVRLSRMTPEGGAQIAVKLESANPAGSVKDRIALAMIEAAEADGTLSPGDTIIEPTSGSTGIGLAMVAAVKGYDLIIVMPDDASEERKNLLRHFGARVVLTPARKLMQGAVDKARGIAAENNRCFIPQQFANPANPKMHRDTTAKEIIEATGGKLTAFVCGVGTGGTITGVGEALKQHNESIEVIAVEPDASQALSGGKVKPHAIQGIGAGFVPKILNRDVIDEIISCSDEIAFETSKQLARQEGISAGLSAGAAVWGGLQVAARLEPNDLVVVMIPDGWERYATLQSMEPSIGGLDFII